MKKEKQEYLSNYEIDSIWMSYRYCIGRHTIASHCHAGEIANHAYGRMSNERTQFMSKDINQSIYDVLHVHDWFSVDSPYNVKNFRPLDMFYQCLNNIGIKDMNDIKKFKCMDCYYDKNGELKTDVYYYNDKDKINFRSYSDITELEVWQRLANLFDLDNHKWCKLTDGRIVEYYEYWTHYRTEDGFEFRQIKCPIDEYHNFAITTRIDEQYIVEDNVNPF